MFPNEVVFTEKANFRQIFGSSIAAKMLGSVVIGFRDNRKTERVNVTEARARASVSVPGAPTSTTFSNKMYRYPFKISFNRC